MNTDNPSSFIDKPIFLVGAERSGTTVLRLMLDHHPQIAWCYEFEYVVDQISNNGDFPQLEAYYEWLETHRIFQGTGFEVDRSLSYPQLANSLALLDWLWQISNLNELKPLSSKGSNRIKSLFY